MNKQREKFVLEMQRLVEEINKTNSPYLKRDYTKKLKKMRKELAEYDYYTKIKSR